jgi:hypothetical protein
MYELFNHKTTLGLYDAVAHLITGTQLHLPRQQTPNGRKVFWSRGNGWALASLARMLRISVRGSSARRVRGDLQGVECGAQGVQRADGFWNMSLRDANHYPGPETSGTALFAYGLAWGINNGLLSPTTYGPVVARAWNGMMTSALHPDGKLGYVQGIGQHPVPTRYVTYESTADFGVGVFLLAGSEVSKLARDGRKYEVENLATAVTASDSHQDVGDVWASGGKYGRGAVNAVGDYVQYSGWISAPGTTTSRSGSRRR